MIINYYLSFLFRPPAGELSTYQARIIAPFSVIILVACGSSIGMSCETLTFIGRIFLCRSQKLFEPSFVLEESDC